ncbi:MAG: polysaccharide biosynthesis protein [Clostridia bacterium]|nr:polysaccharide biosynthesis protein [Clostridia bacterium]
MSNVIIAIVDNDIEELKRIHTFYTGLGCKVKLYDSPVQDETDDESQKTHVIREFEIEDLLFRKPLAINGQREFDFYSEKTVLVTGGGGSIGSELCRQIAKCKPKKLIILDIYENNAYDIQQELIRKYGDTLDLSVEIASVRDRKRLEAVFANYRPNLVFHAAAHKHVPLMEHSGCEAIKNNVLGTYNTADMAEKYGVEKFVLISTDKAVNPTNVMGASKRMCEMVVQCRTDSKTTFAAVRFGNVLGSNGSVIPLFKRQIAQGGPITITDFRIIRYFMTIPEASQLVMQAGAMAKRGELFVLDMGKPIKIYDLAVNMIRLSGFLPNRDIEIKEIGLRPGEKLYEELLIKTEELTKTDNNMIFIEKDSPLTRDEVDAKIAVLQAAVTAAENELGSEKVKEAIKQVVPTFHDPEELNEKAAKTKEMKEANKK